MANSFLDFLESMTIAMEADDITSQTANEVKSAIGGTPSTQTDADKREDEEDLEKVDDIFGTQKPADGPSGNPEKDKAEGAENLPTNDEEDLEKVDDIFGSGENGGDPSTDNPEDSGNDDNMEEDPGAGEEDDNPDGGNNTDNVDLLFTQKNRVRDNLIQLYTIISGDIEILVNSLTNINDQNTINILNVVLNHLRNCKDYIYKTLTQNLTSLEYDELLQRYITLKRVYDICIEMLERHFKNDKGKK